MKNKLRKLKAAVEAGSGGGAAVVEKAKTEIVDGHEIGSDASDAELSVVESGEKFEAGSLVEARKAGHIRAIWWNVEVSAKKSPTGKGGKKAYVRLLSQNARGQVAISKGRMEPAPERVEGQEKPMPGACDFFNYGSDLDRKASVRAQLLTSLEGPEKAVKAAVKGALAGGFEGDALRDFIRNAPKFKGVEGLEKLIDSALAS